MQTKTFNLKPCPFCGSDKIHPGYTATNQTYYRECQQCLARVSQYNSDDAADRAWNDRTPTWTPVATLPDDEETYLTALRERDGTIWYCTSNYNFDVGFLIETISSSKVIAYQKISRLPAPAEVSE